MTPDEAIDFIRKSLSERADSSFASDRVKLLLEAYDRQQAIINVQYQRNCSLQKKIMSLEGLYDAQELETATGATG